MTPEALNALSPVDGRYAKVTEPLREYFSERALLRYRTQVEIEYFIALCRLGVPQLDGALEKEEGIRAIADAFCEDDALRIKEIETVTNHDVKAVEYFIKERFLSLGLGAYQEFIHFGLTSQDINNTAYPLMLKDALEQGGYVDKLQEIISLLDNFSDRWSQVPMLARTHGQAATPTTMGKEMAVFAARLQEQADQLAALPFPAKFGGATGGLNAHRAAYPDVDWESFSDNFAASLGLRRSKPTTQIDHYDNLAAIFDCLRRINVILIDLSRDFWTYISMGYFRLKVNENEVGSSAMPHKVNPIDFENAEGNLGLANAFLTHLSIKLPVSRLQRDLSDSTVLRNVGMPLAYGLIAFSSLVKGLNKISVDKEVIDRDLEQNWQVVAEGIQTILRREGYPHPYEALKQLTRTGRDMDEVTIKEFIEGLDIDDSVKDELRALTPWTY
ncbi:MAG: adenylosuccinate lyase [Bacteroidales bacterium]|nr:adenylosuccinate lyase [Bacteroidales bacterium]